MRKKKIAIMLAMALMLVFAMGIGAYAGANYGSKSDPLITLSYLESVFTGEIMKKVDENTSAAADELAKRLGEIAPGSADDTYKVVTLSQGQVLKGSVGCEIMLRIGTASCAAGSSPGLADTTSGDTIDNGTALARNHLYLVTIEGNGIKAGASSVKVVVRGAYTVS